MTTESSAIERINALSDHEAIEAAQFLSDALDEVWPDAGSQENSPSTDQLKGMTESDLAVLGRIVLSLAAARGHDSLVEESIDGVGRKQLVLGGLELLIIGGAIITTLHVLISKGKTSEKEHIEVERRPGGVEVVRIERNVEYGISGFLGDIVKGATGLREQGGTAPEGAAGGTSD